MLTFMDDGLFSSVRFFGPSFNLIFYWLLSFLNVLDFYGAGRFLGWVDQLRFCSAIVRF